jgi:Zn2+/Cd2+-exporting ATPase
MTHHHDSHSPDQGAASQSHQPQPHAANGKPVSRVCATGSCNHNHEDAIDNAHTLQSQIALVFSIIAIVALLIAWWLSSPIGYWTAFVFAGSFAAIDAFKSLLRGRLTIDTLMIAAGFGAAYIGHVPEGALLLTLFSIGHAAEHYAMERAERSIKALSTLRPLTALRLDPKTNEAVEIPIAEIMVGDTVEVRPDSRIAVDGVVISGQSSVDQAAITGESIPVDKIPLPGFDAKQNAASGVPKDHQVFAGTINGSGTLNVQVTRRSEDSTLARFVNLIAEAKTQRSPSQRLTEVFERRYVPAVLVLVFMLLFVHLVVDETFTQSLYRAMAVLVAASPCALAISTPSAVLSAVARAGREGVLIKGGGPLEQLGQVTVIAFDKTGTLTTGRPELVDVFTMPDVTREELIATAANVQRMSDHPLAQAIVRADRSVRSTSPDTALSITDMHRVAGQGVIANLGDERIAIGNAKMFAGKSGTTSELPAEIAAAERSLRRNGRTIAIVQQGERFLGVLGLVDTPRTGAASAIQKLRQMGLERLVMLSGDHREAANAIAKDLFLDDAKGDLLPADKVLEITAMSATNVTAMVGDGANDAPAMAAASVSIAMGAAGSDVALQTADIALMGDDLSKLPFAIGLGKAAGRIIRQNLWLSLGTIAFLVPATMLGFRLGPAVVLHEGSTVVVVANALRLLRFRMPAG